MKLFIASVIFGSAICYWHFYLFHFVLVFIYLVFFVYEKKIITYSPVSNTYFGVLLFILLWYFLGIGWSNYKIDTLRYIVYLLLGISIVFVFSTWVTTIARFKYVLRTMQNTVIFEFVIIILEIFKIFRLPTSPYSEYAALFHRKGTDFSLLDNDNIVLAIKSTPTGFYGNPNNLAVFVIMTLPFFLLSKKIYVRISGILMSLIVIIATGSRGVFIAFLVGMVMYVFLEHRRFFFVAFLVTILLLSTGTISSVIDILKNSDNKRISEIAWSIDVLSRYLGERSKSGDSISIRQQLIENGIIELKRSNGLGVGGGTSIAIQMSKYGLEVGSMHNFWIEILVEGGVIAFFLFVSWYLFLMYKLLFISKRTNNNFISYISRSLFLSMCFFSIGCISASSVIYHLAMWLMFGMAISIIHINKNIYCNYSAARSKLKYHQILSNSRKI